MSNENNYRILVVDDLATIHQDFRKILLPEERSSSPSMDKMNKLLTDKTEKAKLPPFQIDSAYQGAEGVEFVHKALAEGKPYAVAFIDVLMPPGEDGVEALSKIWELDRNMQIVICTAYNKYSWEDLRERFGETDRLFVLKKPFDNMEVVQLATSLSKKWNLNRNVEKFPSKSLDKEESNKSLSHLRDTIQELESLNEKLKHQNLSYREGKSQEKTKD